MLKKAVLGLIGCIACSGMPSQAQDAAYQTGVPFLFSQDMRREMPDLQGIRVLRFVTSGDFAPFQLQHEGKSPTGYNVDLARALCAELDVACTIQVLPWDGLQDAVVNGRADAVIAGHKPTTALRQKVNFSHPYFRIPARFVVRKDHAFNALNPSELTGKKIAVQQNTAHEAFLKAYFPASIIEPKENTQAMVKALAQAEVDAVFGDGVHLSNWLGKEGEACCSFAGDAYFESHFFGEGMAIAIRKEDSNLKAGLDYALASLEARGVLLDLYLRWFPVNFYQPQKANP